MVKNPPSMPETWVRSLGWEDSPGRGHGNPLQYSCLENPHGQRSLVGYSPWGCKESDMTERLNTFCEDGVTTWRTENVQYICSYEECA